MATAPSWRGLLASYYPAIFERAELQLERGAPNPLIHWRAGAHDAVF